ncbi:MULTISPECIES: acyl carrier protein [Streptomyces]|uniref:Carrier domain-containing protein n=2 Tax=Streptomyces scabiei TaxID=1930 RepID=C9ZCB2_STRSW|nr:MULTISPECIES: acyl carrier protein [Streptomyces]MBP5863875.1 acyl carrier protein [Streptomyces sp. LBUM 1484]MBP5867152.1 acyl carrier protein [Streptomyces sp. LBUM 1485]MBP5905729.1 acyl carrier protein [Streptomyces sp. LBUM 1478]MBP5931682.1 acyl carrier protein [Streptomyces sp. LBUM 1479]KFG06879.1 acyl carrier protein [Streptomyces scabiei]
MHTIDDFVRLVRDELGMPLEEYQISADLDQLPEWDSLYLLKLVTALEQAAGRSLPVGRLLEARSLGEIYQLAARP